MTGSDHTSPTLERKIRRLLIKNVACPMHSSLDMINRTFASSAQTRARILGQSVIQDAAHYWCWRSLTQKLEYSGRFMVWVLVEGLRSNPSPNPDLIVMSFIILLLEYISCVVTRTEFTIRGQLTSLSFAFTPLSRPASHAPHQIWKAELYLFATVHNMSHLQSCSMLS